MDATFGDRLRQWRESAGFTQKEMAAQLGIALRTYSRYELSGDIPKGAALKSLAEMGCDVGFLITGVLRPVSVAAVPAEEVQLGRQGEIVQTHFKAPAEVVPPEFSLIPRFDLQAAAGGGAISEREDVAEMLAFRRDWLHRMGVSAASARVITVRGDSMYPTLQNGDVILIDTDDEKWFDEGGIYVIRVDSRLLVKRIATKVGGALLLISENPVYPPEEIPSASDLDIIGQVKWYGRAL
jgi:phage repressor protein C with HTH and peptisase S24 domain